MVIEKVMVMTGYVLMLKFCRCLGINVSDVVLIINININNSYYVLSIEYRVSSIILYNFY